MSLNDHLKKALNSDSSDGLDEIICTERGLTQRLTMLLIEYVFTHSGPEAALSDSQFKPARPLSLDIAAESAWLRLSNRSSQSSRETPRSCSVA